MNIIIEIIKCCVFARIVWIDLKRKINTLNNVDGTLQALQAIGGILEQTNQVFIQLQVSKIY